jgi:TetR/AcrR family transcriptional repressor of nem operon
MPRPREFDRDAALDRAMKLFWEKGFAATSTDSLLAEMGIGRQSLYNAFGDKRQLYLEVLRSYQQMSVGGHLKRLNEPASPLEGILELLSGLAAKDRKIRALGCFGVSSIGEFGTSDPELRRLGEAAGALLRGRIAERIREGQALGEIDPGFEAEEGAAFVLMSMMGLQVTARAGAGVKDMQRLAAFAVERLKA